MRRTLSVAVLVCGAIVAAARAPRAAPDDNWPQWRGPGGSGVALSSEFVDEWAPGKNIAWKAPLTGRGLSSPVVWGDRLFLTTSIEGELAPGNKAPVHLGYDLKPGYVHPDSVGSDHRYTLQVLAFDARTGKRVWERTSYEGAMYDDRHRKNTYASPTVVTDGKFVYAFFESAGLYCYDVEGNLIWKVSLGGIAKAGLGPGTSPVLYENLVILQCDQEMGEGSFIAALDRRTGREVWRAARTTRRSWATPLLVRTPRRTELVASAAEAVIAYDPATGKELWRANGTHSHPIPSAVAGHGLVFVTAGSQAKRAMAIKAGSGGDLTNSPAIVWKYEEDGDTFVVKAGPTHEILRTNSIGEPVYASPALAGGTLYLRGEQHLFAIRAPGR